MMAPILEELRARAGRPPRGRLHRRLEEHGRSREVRHRPHPDADLFCPDGRELFRHEGFFAKEEILAKWQELGVTPKGS
ncbi:MAG: hypothetical protein IPM94_14375 [bacterium]|nr:hypothetical protein [bacterium]